MSEGTLYAELRWPGKWPDRPERLLSQGVNGVPVALWAHPDGSLELRVQTGKEGEKWKFQPIRMSGSGFAKIAVSWGRDATLAINGKLIPLFDPKISGDFNIDLKPIVGSEQKVVEFTEASLNATSRDERFFVETLRDMEQKIAGSTYDYTRLAGLVRQLLMDSNPLAHKINREFHIPIRFTVVNREMIPPDNMDEPFFHLMSLHPDGAPAMEVSLEKFLNLSVLRFNDEVYSVKEVIRTVAHVYGGVHSGEPENEMEKKLVALGELISAHNAPMPIYAVHDIARVVASALLPLVAAIAAKYS